MAIRAKNRPLLGDWRPPGLPARLLFAALVAGLLAGLLPAVPGSLIGGLVAVELQAAEPAEPHARSKQEIIRELIEKLGSDSYATRVRARDRLKAYGLEAFDALRDALDHEDSEVLTAARYLISSLQVGWAEDSDPKAVREILDQYGAQVESERLGRIKMLGLLRDQKGVEALARLARFERSVALSRQAAILVLKQPLGSEKASRQRLADRIEDVIGDNQRHASQWLLAYAEDLREGRFTTSRWKQLVRQERQRVDTGSGPEVTSASVMKLIRVLATRAVTEGDREAALQLVLEHIDLVAPKTRDLAEHCAWSIRQGLFPVVLTLYERHPNTFDTHAELLYSAAQALVDSGKSEQGEQLAMQAMRIKPFPTATAEQTEADEQDDGDAPQARPSGLTDHQLEEIAYAHHQVARLLRRRGRFEWAEREDRAVIEHCDLESAIGASARQSLAMTFSEQLRHDEAAEILAPIVDRAKKDRLYQARMARWRISVPFLRSLYEYESGLELLNQADQPPSSETLDAVKKKLQLAYRFDTDNIDILIRMYRLDDPDDPDWKPTVMKQIAQNREKLARDISVIEARKSVIPEAQYEAELGDLYNQYAWLVANTKGDYVRALKLSQDSLKFLDNDQTSQRAARLDTCARCLFAVGRVAEAIRTQKEAIKLEPHSPPMLRQLEEFKAAL